MQKITIWSSTCRQHVPRKIGEIFKDMPDVFSIADDILVVGYEADGRIMTKQYMGCC